MGRVVALEAVLRERFGLEAFRPGQREVLEAVLGQGAALAVFPTGGGKSLCYQLPALVLDGLTLVVSPLLALMKDQLDALTRRGVAAARLDSTLSREEARAVEAGVRAGTVRLLYVAPERFNNERFLALLAEARIALFAVDEAHCVSEWGHNFRPDYLKLADAARALGAERVLALTATATPAVAEDICRTFGIAPEGVVRTGSVRENLALELTPVAAAERDALLVERLRARPPGPTIVYVTLQRTAERVAGLLSAAGVPAAAYHAGLEAEARAAVQEAWMASERGVVVATIAFGMGIDKADVRYVYHYNLPKSLESYSQEVGRAGRDGRPSTVELLACPDDVPTLENFAYGDTPGEAALTGLVEELLAGPAEQLLHLDDLALRHDLRPLVLRTALTYLELAGVLRQGTPQYLGARVRVEGELPALLARFDARRAEFLGAVFAAAKEGRSWYSLEPARVAEGLGVERERVERALDYLKDQGLAEVERKDVRHRFTVLRPDAEARGLGAELAARFHKREAQEVARVAQVLALVQHPGCQTNALAAYFGEVREAPCGHCSACRAGAPARLPPLTPRPPLAERVDAARLAALVRKHPAVLGEPRARARLLCGLASPRLSKAGLQKDALFGAVEDVPFAEVLAFVGD